MTQICKISSRRWMPYGLGFFLWLTLLGIGFLSVPTVEAETKQMTVQDIIVLLQVGYKEAAVLKEIQKRKMAGKFALKPAQVLQLSKVGASMKLIRAMGIGSSKPQLVASKPVSFQELKTWLRQKKSESWLRKVVQRRGVVAAQFSMSAVLKLRKQGMSLQLLRLVVQLKNKAKSAARPVPRPVVRVPSHPVTPPAVRVPSHPVTPPAVRVPSHPVTPPVQRREPSIPFPVIRQPVLRPVKRIKKPMLSVKTTRWGVRPKQALPLTEREKRVMQRSGVRLYPSKDGRFRHISGFFQIKVPTKWNIVKDIHPSSGDVSILFTPEKTLKVAQIKYGLWIQLEYVRRSDRRIQTRSLQQTARFLIQHYLMKESGVSEKGRLKSIVLHGYKAVQAGLVGKARLDAHPLRKRIYLLRTKDYFLQIGLLAPPKKFDAFVTQVKPFLRSLRLISSKQKIRGTRQTTAVAAQKVIQRNMPGVVSIMCMMRKNGKLKPISTGSGFVVTSDGYVLTNHHVAMHSGSGKPYDVYYLNWDSTTGRKFARARFVGAYMKQARRGRVRMIDSKTGRISVRFQRQHVDIALLKIIKAGTYPTVQLSSVKRAMLGDQVIAMGFPSEGASINTMGNESITTTIGVISRLVRMSDKRVNEIQHSAKVAGGNSGGPLFDVHTGAVIGINTWVGVFDKRLSRPGMGLGYYYAIPIDLAWQYFPDFIDPKAKSYSPDQWYELGVTWLAAQQWEPARRAFLRVIRMKPKMAVVYLKLAQLYLSRATKHNDDRRHGWLKLSRRWADRGLRQEINHPNLMTLLAQVAIERKDWSTAQYLLKQLVQKNPYDWRVFALQAVVFNQQGKYKQALQNAQKVIQLGGKLLPVGHLLRGMILYRARRFFEGQQAYRMALRIDPTNLRALVSEAMGYTHLKQYDDALSRLNLLAKKRNYEPDVYESLMYTYASKKDFLRAWKAFNTMWRSSMLRSQTINAFALYMGGLLARRVLSPKVRERLQWGLWGSVVGSHNLSSTAQTAGVSLALAVGKRGYRGLAYGLLQRINTPIANKKIAKLYKKLRRQLPRRGISQKAWLYITTRTSPRWSPALIWDLFSHTPSILQLRTAKRIAKRGFPIPLLLKMLALSKKRRKRGINPTLQNNRRTAIQKHRSMIIRTILRAFQALRDGDVNLWMSLQHPAVHRRQRAQIFWNMVNRLRNGSISMRSYQPYQIKIQRHRQYGLVGQYFFRLRVKRRYFKRFWRLRYYRGRWLMF